MTKPTRNPFLATSEYDGSDYVSLRCSLNRAVLAKLPLYGVEDEIEGLHFNEIFSTPLIVGEIRRLSRHYRIDLSEIPDARLPMILNDALVSDDVRYHMLGERVVRKFGNRLGLLFLALRLGERENRLARVDWDDACWDWWRETGTLILTGGLASSMLGRRFKEQVHGIFDRVGERPYRIRLYDNGAYLGVMGLAQRLMRDDETALVFDLGHTNSKRALVRRSGGVIAGFSAFETLPTRFMQSRFDSDSEKFSAALSLHNNIVKMIVSTYKEAREVTAVSDRIYISIANYTYSGRLNTQRGGYAKLSALGGDNYAAVLEESLSGELRRDIKVRLVHDATATALYFSDIPDAICLTLGTAFGIGFPDIKVKQS